uniref:Uncharacterized protein n=1 Tax=Timema shepardi TaxID=629360 RepID=A0A7R9B931_TIMSH|nr:unnamed protein product [Timema shepardi]
MSRHYCAAGECVVHVPTLTVQLESELSRLREEQEIMQQRAAKDRAAVSSLEDMLADSRHEAVEQRAANQSLQAQVAQLQTNISDLQEKLALETAEVRRYASQAAALNQQVTELQREVVNVRFNHARATEGQSKIKKEKHQIPNFLDAQPDSTWNGSSSVETKQTHPRERTNKSRYCGTALSSVA